MFFSDLDIIFSVLFERIKHKFFNHDYQSKKRWWSKHKIL